MTAFIIIAIASLAGVVFFRTAVRFQAARPAPGTGRMTPRFSAGAYLKWLGLRIKGFFSAAFLKRAWALWLGWTGERYPGWLKWIFFAFAAGFLYLAASGLLFAVFVRRGMFGLPLLAHVMGGGLFALGLAAILMLRARAYRFDQAEAAVFESFACPIFKNLSRALVGKALFWVFAMLGFVQIVTALCSMLPVFTFNTQVALIMIHRYSALGLVLTAILYFDVAVPAGPKTPRA